VKWNCFHHTKTKCSQTTKKISIILGNFRISACIKWQCFQFSSSVVTDQPQHRPAARRAAAAPWRQVPRDGVTLPGADARPRGLPRRKRAGRVQLRTGAVFFQTWQYAEPPVPMQATEHALSLIPSQYTEIYCPSALRRSTKSLPIFN